MHTNANGATNFQVFRCSFDHLSQPDAWQLVVPHNPDIFIESIALTSAFLVLMEKADALNRITVHDLQSNLSFCIDFPEEVYCLYPRDAGSSHYFQSNIIRFSYSSPTTPSSMYEYSIETKQRVCIKVQEIPSGHNPSDYRVSRLNAPTADGQLVPIFLLHHAKTSPSAECPLYVYGYGSYGCSCDPYFDASVLSLVDRGWLAATACVRGGSDKGRNWFLDGRLFSKKNTFTDFIAAIEHLHSLNYGCKATTITHGASAGGLLTGAVTTMRPDVQAACVMQVPFVDVLNTMSDDTLPLTPMEWPEWGNPLVSEEAYDYIASYSPYDNVRDTVYPTTLILGGLTDSRVTYSYTPLIVLPLFRFDERAQVLGAGEDGCTDARSQHWPESNPSQGALLLFFSFPIS